jgi:hypothetical protein
MLYIIILCALLFACAAPVEPKVLILSFENESGYELEITILGNEEPKCGSLCP